MAAAEPPAPQPAILYVDTSALLKLLVREAESAAIERELLTWNELATSAITEVELPWVGIPLDPCLSASEQSCNGAPSETVLI